MAQLSLKTGTSQALSLEPVEDGALLAPTDKKSIYLDQGNLRKEIKTGHTIQNSSEVNIADRDTLQFTGNVSVSDDSINNKTIIDIEADNSITALKETSPTTSAHEVGTYLTYNNVIYSVKSAIAVGDTLTVDTNIEVADIPEGAVVYWEDDSAPSGQVQSDWNQTDNTQPDYIKNKPSDDVVTLNGNPLSFTTDSEQAARECVITLEPIQAGSGDPSPSNVRAISGYDSVRIVDCGFNIWNGKYYDKAIIANTGEPPITDSPNVVHTDYIVVGPNTDYYFRTVSLGSGFYGLAWYDANKVYISGKVFSEGSGDVGIVTSPSNARYVRASIYTNDISTTCINISKTSGTPKNGDYVAYQSFTDLTLTLPETVYGGTLNVETGELVVDRVYVSGNKVTWVQHPNNSNIFYTNAFRDDTYKDSTELSALGPENEDTVAVGLICNNYNKKTWNSLFTSSVDYGIAIAANGMLGIKNTGMSSLTDWNNVISDIQIVYTIKYPYTIHLTPAQVRLLQGNNVVTTNGTSIKLTYRNGEVATLEDVSSVAESVNALGEAVNEVNAGLATKADETEVAAIENVYGSKNLLPNNATTQTINGVTFTINADKSVTANGTATNWAVLMLTTSVFNAGTYRVVDVLDTEPYIVVRENNGSGTILCSSDTGYEFTLTTSKTLWVAIAVRPNTTVNKTVYPMIRDARISDSTYVPYAMTNRELTETIKDIRTGGITFSLSNESYKLVPVTFSKPMKNDQYVVFSNAEGGNSTYRFFISATNKSASGFSLYIVTDDTTQITTPTRAVGWVAIAL